MQHSRSLENVNILFLSFSSETAILCAEDQQNYTHSDTDIQHNHGTLFTLISIYYGTMTYPKNKGIHVLYV